MTEDEAQDWLRAVLDVSRETLARLDAYRRMVIAEAARQNLIAASTIDHFWARHIVDSAQLLTLSDAMPNPPRRPGEGRGPANLAAFENSGTPAFAGVTKTGGARDGRMREAPAPWLDLGSGAGLPGIVLAILNPAPIHLVESRKGRIGFLEAVVRELDLANATIHPCRLETLETFPASVITARAFAPLPKLFGLAHRFSTKNTLWLLPKGVSARSEVESVRGTWQGVFHVKQSLTDAAAQIIVASGVKKSGKA